MPKTFLIAITALAAANGVSAIPFRPSPLVKFAETKQVPSYWESQGTASGATEIRAQIGLKQGNIQGLREKFLDISNPDSPNYARWLSKEEVAEYTAPSENSAEAVKSWLAYSGITDVSQPTNDWIEFNASVSKLETILNAKYEWYTHSSTGVQIPRTQQYSLPESLHGFVDVVAPTTSFYNSVGPQRHDSTQATGSTAGSVTPDFIRSAYNVDYVATGSELVASTGFLGIGASHYDYETFGRQFVPGLRNFRDVSVNGGYNNGDGTPVEGNLDTQYIGGLSHPNPNEYLSVAPTDSRNAVFNEAILAVATYLNTASNPPSVVSISYGGEERFFDPSYLDRICYEFMKAGSRGISVFVSSGDNGVGGNGEPSCASGFFANWPASCPWVTTVGGTEFDPNTGREVVAQFGQYTNGSAMSPGGGFSEHFPAPPYSGGLSRTYASSLTPREQTFFNAAGRGYPDISLASVKYQVVVNGRIEPVLGTSASSPSVAALFSLLNDYRRANGRARLGFVNPLLYSNRVRSDAIRDVTEGSNPGCASNGFPAAQGWDAASGLGSFDFARLRRLV